MAKETLRDMAAWILDWLGERNCLCPSGQSRLHRLCRFAVNNSANMVEPDSPEFTLALKVLKDCQEFRFICDRLGNYIDNCPRMADRMKTALGDGDDIPGITITADYQSAAAQSPGRDAQFELLIGAIHGGCCTEIAAGEAGQADWLVESEVGAWCAEAKRIHSRKKLFEKITHAGDQIRRTNRRGFIFLDVSLLTDVQDRLVIHNPAKASLNEAVGQWRTNFRTSFYHDMVQAAGRNQVLAIVIFDWAIIETRENPHETGMPRLQAIWLRFSTQNEEGAYVDGERLVWDFLRSAMPMP